jgi:hypothetical protein
VKVIPKEFCCAIATPQRAIAAEGGGDCELTPGLALGWTRETHNGLDEKINGRK